MEAKQIYVKPQMPQKPDKKQIAASLALLQGIADTDEQKQDEQPETLKKKGIEDILDGIECF